jgi:hypothetical protein
VRTAITLNDFVFDSSPGFDEVADHVVAAEPPALHSTQSMSRSARLASNSTAPGRSRELMIDPISVPSTSNAQITIAALCCRCRRSRWYRCACG